jgi:hypothetical protein
MSDQGELSLTQSSKWSRVKYREGRKTCGRVPEGGPGTCKLWWEGCPKGEKRNCYLLWWRQNKDHEVPFS